MTPFEAMNRLIAVADYYREEEGGRPDQEAQTEDNVAVAVITAMLNTALPIARFRAFVEVDAKSQRRGLIRDEYTVCSPTIHGILAGLIGLHHARTDVRVTLWEQKAKSASMVSGFQGPTKSKRYKSWVQELIFQFDVPEQSEVEAAANGEE